VCKPENFAGIVNLKVGVWLTHEMHITHHALHGSLWKRIHTTAQLRDTCVSYHVVWKRTLCKNVHKRLLSHYKCWRVYACADRCNCRKSNTKGEMNMLEWTYILFTTHVDNLSRINVMQAKVCFIWCWIQV